MPFFPEAFTTILKASGGCKLQIFVSSSTQAQPKKTAHGSRSSCLTKGTDEKVTGSD